MEISNWEEMIDRLPRYLIFDQFHPCTASKLINAA